MDRNIAWGNIKRLRGQLISEIDRSKRSRIEALLLKEYDKLGEDLKLTIDLEEQIRKGRELIAWQNVLVTSTEQDGHLGNAEARSLLGRLEDSQNLHENYLKKIMNKKTQA